MPASKPACQPNNQLVNSQMITKQFQKNGIYTLYNYVAAFFKVNYLYFIMFNAFKQPINQPTKQLINHSDDQ